MILFWILYFTSKHRKVKCDAHSNVFHWPWSWIGLITVIFLWNSLLLLSLWILSNYNLYIYRLSGIQQFVDHFLSSVKLLIHLQTTLIIIIFYLMGLIYSIYNLLSISFIQSSWYILNKVGGMQILSLLQAVSLARNLLLLISATN